MSSDFSIKIYGCRGSFPVAGPPHQRYGGATSCVVARAGTRQIVLDAGTGVVTHGQDLMEAYFASKVPIRTQLFFTHLHLDHLVGLPFFTPMYLADATIEMWGPRMGHFESFEQAIDTLIHPPFFPVPLHEMLSSKRFHDITEGHSVYFLHGVDEPVTVRKRHPEDQAKIPAAEDIEVAVHCMRGYNHPKSGVFFYKIEHGDKSMVYATDTEGYVHGDRRLIDFARGASVLIHDAMYTSDRYISMPASTQGYGHSTVEIAARVAEIAQVDKLVLFHHDPASDDAALDQVDALGKSVFPNSVAARDGLVIEL